MRTITLALLLIFLLLLIVFSGPLKDRLALNLAALDTLHILYSGEPLLDARPAWPGESSSCTANWMAALQAGALGDLKARDQAFRQAAACDPQVVVFMQRMYPEDLSLAQMALDAQPASAESWFWAGDLQPEKQIEYYQQGLAIDPQDGRRWLTLGQLLRDIDPQSAMEAYLNSCRNGDPGYHGCLGAGQMAEKLGYIQKAIEFYRLSSYSKILEKANMLEKELTPIP